MSSEVADVLEEVSEETGSNSPAETIRARGVRASVVLLDPA
jgi:hypothetical protein